jgi:predicted transcriptional regulator
MTEVRPRCRCQSKQCAHHANDPGRCERFAGADGLCDNCRKAPKAKLETDSTVARELDLASELFHRINRIIPQDQKLLWIPPNCRVRDAIGLMHKNGYSQMPVVDEGEVLGVFSFRSFAKEAGRATLDEWNKEKCAPGDLTVDEFLEQFDFARVSEEMNHVFDAMDRDNGVLIGTPERLIGILTPMDFLRYLYQVASPFVMISEIELALRALIHMALTEENIAAASRRCLGTVYGGEDKVPTTLEEMTFDNYQSLVSHGDNWAQFEPVFGGNRPRASAKLKEIAAVRNDLFHFKREITIQDHQTLAAHRNWLLNKIKQAEVHRRPEAQL